MVAIAAKCDGTRSETLHQLLGELLYPLVERSQPDRAGRITGMLLQLPDAEVALLIQSDEALSARLVEAADLLDGHISAREEALSDGAAADEASAGAPLPRNYMKHLPAVQAQTVLLGRKREAKMPPATYARAPGQPMCKYGVGCRRQEDTTQNSTSSVGSSYILVQV